MTTQAEIKAGIKEVLALALGLEGDIPDAEPFLQGDINSAKALEVLLGLEERFGITIDDGAIEPQIFRSVDNLAALVERTMAAG
ncbi:MAG: acyl carrier protein [Polyangiaceae bacterium]|nr:acyl carrier protein [Polyangiaceae bacterium]